MPECDKVYCPPQKKITLMQVSGHTGIMRNKKADKFARIGDPSAEYLYKPPNCA